MNLNGERTVPASQLRTWQALNDPEVLRQCIPGCEAIVADGEGAYRVEMAARIGPVSAKFKGKLRVFDVVAPASYRLEFEGQGGVAGFGKGGATVHLESLAPRELWVNEASRFRLDIYPFGGSKKSGSGREGVRCAMEEMSQLKFTGIRVA